MACCETNTGMTGNPAGKTLKVDFLFLDESICEPCGSTSKAIAEAIEMLDKPLKSMGIDLQVEKIHVADKEIAIAEKLLSSPTIRVNGKDIDPARTEDDCPTCGTLAGDATSVSCRTWHWQGKVYQAAPIGKVVEEIMAAALYSPDNKDCGCNDSKDARDFELPDNLKNFFKARGNNQQSGC